MICSFKHKGLEKFFERGDKRGVVPDHAKKLQNRLSKLNAAKYVDDMNIKNWRYKELKGGGSIYQINVNGAWRLRFEFRDGNAYSVDYGEFH